MVASAIWCSGTRSAMAPMRATLLGLSPWRRAASIIASTMPGISASHHRGRSAASAQTRSPSKPSMTITCPPAQSMWVAWSSEAM